MRPWGLIFILSFSYGRAFAFTPDASACEAYAQKAQDLSCDDSNYLIKFGHYYCREITQHLTYFSLRGQADILSIRQCLIEEMMQDSALTCSNSRRHAEKSHFICYTQYGFCKMNPIDQLTLANMVYLQMLDPGFRSTMLAIIGTCGMSTDASPSLY